MLIVMKKQASAEEVRAVCDYIEGLVAAFDGAGTGNDGQICTADGGIGAGEVNDGVFFLYIPAGQLVGLGNADDFGDSGKIFNAAAFDFALIAGNANRGALRAGQRVGAKA